MLSTGIDNNRTRVCLTQSALCEYIISSAGYKKRQTFVFVSNVVIITASVTSVPVDKTQAHRPAADNQPQISPANTLNGDNSDGFSDISPLAGPPPEGRGGDGGRRPPGPGRRGPERGGRGERRDPPEDGPEGGDRMSEGQPRTQRAPVDEKGPADHAPRHRKAPLYGTAEEGSQLRRESDQPGISEALKETLHMLVF